MKLTEIPIGTRCTITTSVFTNNATGEQIFNKTYQATATGEYQFDQNAVLRRKFTDCCPLIFNNSEVWLGEGNLSTLPVLKTAKGVSTENQTARILVS